MPQGPYLWHAITLSCILPCLQESRGSQTSSGSSLKTAVYFANSCHRIYSEELSVSIPSCITTTGNIYIWAHACNQATVLERLRQKDYKLETTLSTLVRLCPNNLKRYWNVCLVVKHLPSKHEIRVQSLILGRGTRCGGFLIIRLKAFIWVNSRTQGI